MTKNFREQDIIQSLRKTSDQSMPDQKFKTELSKKLADKIAQKNAHQPSIIDKIKPLFKNYQLFFAAVCAVVVFLTSFSFLNKKDGDDNNQNDNQNSVAKVSDWQYQPITYDPEGVVYNSSLQKSMVGSGAPLAMEDSANIGLSAGGAKDINNFRHNIKNKYFPLSTDITYEGLFYDYSFDTGAKKECTELFCPSYSIAKSADPFSGEDDYFMTVGLNSGIKESDFARKKLNLVVVMDISGSMGSGFDSYYYDNPEDNKEDEAKSKMQIARESVAEMTKHLSEEDSFGMVLFDDSAYLAKPLSKVGNTNMDEIRKNILQITEQGGTNMESGYKKATQMLQELSNKDPNEYENRVVFLTDAMPNTGDISENGLVGMVAKNSEAKIYTTFVGVGVDFNTGLIEAMTKTEGANYYSVHSSKDFKKRLDEEFDFMVTPLVFDLNLAFQSESFEIEKVYGSPQADESTGSLMKVKTLFPSSNEDGETKGGVVLLKLKYKTGGDGVVNLTATYKNRAYQESNNVAKINYFDEMPKTFARGDYYENNGIQKAILLSRYANIMRNWINEERQKGFEEVPVVYFDEYCYKCTQYRPFPTNFSQWERNSTPLSVSQKTKISMQKFKEYFQTEAKKINDEDLQKEVEILDTLINSSTVVYGRD